MSETAKYRVVISESIFEDALVELREVAELHYDPDLYRNREALGRALSRADALIVRNQTRVDEALLAQTPRLRVVGRLGVGLDNLDREALRARGVVLTWSPGSNAVSVAEYVMGAMLLSARRFVGVAAETRQGQWNRFAAVGTELRGKHLGIIGLGDIGSRLARRAQAFGMTVLAHDPALHPDHFALQEFGVFLADLESVLQTSDFISLHAPLTPATRHLLGARTLELVKPGATLINTARGGLIDEQALVAALQRGRLAGAVLDVREQEPPEEDDPLRELPNVILTPHVAGVTEESNRRTSFRVVRDVLRVLLGTPPLSRAPESG